jgi:type IV pilus assembly protein PilM
MKPSSSEADASVDILLVAAKKDKVSNYSNVVQQAKKNLHVIEVDVFALQNTMEINYPEDSKEKTIAIINLGANATNVIVSEKEIPQLFRDLSIGGALIAENIRKDLGTSAEDAEKILKGMPGADISEEQSQSAINTNVENLFEEIEKTFSFYGAGEGEEKKIDKVFLSGGLANLKGLAKSFEDRFKIETEIFNPFRNIFYNDKKLDSTFFQELSPLFGVASGLAIRKMEE